MVLFILSLLLKLKVFKLFSLISLLFYFKTSLAIQCDGHTVTPKYFSIDAQYGGSFVNNVNIRGFFVNQLRDLFLNFDRTGVVL